MPAKHNKGEPWRVYVAILNRGWIRREMYYHLNRMGDTSGVTMYLENLDITWANPIHSNRNQIVRRFLGFEPACEWLMMIDDDIYPVQHNPLTILQASNINEMDIIGFPAKVRQQGRAMNWVAYVKHPTEEAYGPIDFGKVDSDLDLLRCDSIGTGMILIQRHVLEAIAAPFNIVEDEHGVCTVGTDFAFCARAREAGFKIYTTPWRRCEHIKQVGLLDITGYDDSDYSDFAAARYKMQWGEWAISQSDWRFITAAMDKYGVQRVVEFGTGLSSLLMSERAEVLSYEVDGKYAAKIREKVTADNKLEIVTWDGTNMLEAFNLGDKVDLVFVDGPVGKANGGPGREASMMAAAMLADVVIVHDAGRAHEMQLQAQYLKPHFKLVGSNGQHASRSALWERKK